MERNTQPSNVRAEAGLSFYTKLTARKGWISQVNSEWNEVEYPNLRYAEGCHKYPGTVSAALLDDHSKAVSLHTKSLR